MGALAFLYLLVGLRFGVPNVFDEGHQVLGAARVLEGHVPYRDFVFLYPPGELIVLAIAFRVFGTTILVKRVVAIAIDAALAACVYLLSRRLLPGPWAVGPAAVYVLWKGGAFWPGQYQAGRALSLVCASLALLILPESAGGRPPGGRRFAAAGALAGLGVAARLDTGLAMSLALGVSAVFVAVRAALARSTHPARRRRDALGAAWRGALPFGLGWVGSVGLVSLAVGTVAGLRDPLHDVVFFPIYYLPHEERSFPPLRDLLGLLAGETSAISYAGRVYYTSFIYVSVVVLPAAGVLCLRRLSTGWPSEPQTEMGIHLTLLGLALLPTASRRPDAGHFEPIVAVTSILLVWLGHEGYAWLRQRRRSLLLPITGAIVATGALVAAVGPQRTRVDLIRAELGLPGLPGGGTAPPVMVPIGLPRAGGVYADEAYVGPLVRAVAYVQRSTERGERILVANRQHRTVFINDLMFYFLAERNPVTRLDLFMGGFTTTQAVQGQIVADLDRRPGLIVVNTDEGLTRPEGAAPSSTLLDEHIAAHYEAVADFGNYRVLRRAAPR